MAKGDKLLVGVCELSLMIYESYSLKKKRSVIKSLLSKLSNKFNISVCESGDNDDKSFARIGIAVVGNSKAFLNDCIDAVIDFSDCQDEFEIIDIYREVY